MSAFLAMLPSLVPFLDDALKAAFPDPIERQQKITEFLSQYQKSDQMQADLLKLDASGDKFQRYWRPFIGWSLGFALVWQFVLVPNILWVSYWAGYPMPAPPALDPVLWELITAMLGVAGLRSFDKWSKK